jgi:hypothetical protein
LAPFSLPPPHANHGDLGLFPRKQYIIRVGLVKGKKGFCQSVVSNRSPDVQKLFLRDSTGNIMYKISLKNKLQTTQINKQKKTQSVGGT